MKLHVGCGLRQIPGFYHVDLVRYDHVDLVAPAWDLCLPDGAATLVYACHVLEHMRRPAYLNALREFHRVLQPGGILRVAVPNMREWCAVYLETGSLELAHGSIYGRQDYEENTHYQGFDEAKLSADLLAAGFAEPRRYDWRETEHAQVDDLSQTYLPHLDRAGRLMSLNMEATRP
jgi:SAM-dependent methyltransferase